MMLIFVRLYLLLRKRKQKQKGYTKYRELKHNNKNTYLMKNSAKMANDEEEKR